MQVNIIILIILGILSVVGFVAGVLGDDIVEYFSDEVYINKINNVFTFNEAKLNSTILDIGFNGSNINLSLVDEKGLQKNITTLNKTFELNRKNPDNDSIQININQVNNLLSSAECDGSNKVNNVSITDSGVEIVCGTDQTGGGVTDHGDLTGLGDDDHPQYLLNNDFGLFQNSLKQNISTLNKSVRSLNSSLDKFLVNGTDAEFNRIFPKKFYPGYGTPEGKLNILDIAPDKIVEKVIVAANGTYYSQDILNKSNAIGFGNESFVLGGLIFRTLYNNRSSYQNHSYEVINGNVMWNIIEANQSYENDGQVREHDGTSIKMQIEEGVRWRGDVSSLTVEMNMDNNISINGSVYGIQIKSGLGENNYTGNVGLQIDDRYEPRSDVNRNIESLGYYMDNYFEGNVTVGRRLKTVDFQIFGGFDSYAGFNDFHTGITSFYEYNSNNPFFRFNNYGEFVEFVQSNKSESSTLYFNNGSNIMSYISWDNEAVPFSNLTLKVYNNFGDIEIGNPNNFSPVVIKRSNDVNISNTLQVGGLTLGGVYRTTWPSCGTGVGDEDGLQNNITTLNITFNNYIATLNKTVESLSSSNGGGWESANYLGSDLSGTSGDANRVLSATADFIVVDNFYLHPEVDYTKSGNDITFTNPVWDDMRITVFYSTNLNYTNILGSALTGSNGDINRQYTTTNVSKVVVDNFLLHPTVDYTFSSSTLNFNNPIWNDQQITLWYEWEGTT